MTFLNFIDTGFIITFSLLILFSGAIILYCYKRLNLLENSVIEHGKILQNFIINYNNQILANKKFPDNMIQRNNSEYIDSNNENNENNENIKNVFIEEESKISISDEESDNEESEDEESDNEESDNEESDNEESENEDEVINTDNNTSTNDDDNDDNDDDKLKIIESVINDDILVEDLDNNENLKIDLTNTDTLSLDINITSKIINLEETSELELEDKNNEKKNYSKMKVDDLRSLAVTKSLTDNENALKMKKNDLIKLLQNID